ncbi:glycosyltransferase family 4 protein [Desulfobacula sp.]|uniref:glycosyltransferase family 4 protein n=1 Tax=Desulfobacula sp. TaxID=2593537 RepID=UPI001EBC4BA6|nr:glycosyltransferase family 4 protein [Desulfobacula sp.]
MKILYISQYFPPEAGATQTRAFENARYLKSKGHDVIVLCEIPNHPAGIIFKGYQGRLFKKEVLEGIRVLYIRVFTSQRKNFLTRLAFYLSFMAGASLAGMFLLKDKFDLIYATSPPLPAAGAGLWLSLYKKNPFYFEVRDIWPDSAIELGELKNSFVIKMAGKLESMCYARAKKVIAVTKGIEKALKNEKQIPVHKVEFIPNGATIDSFFRDQVRGENLRSDLGLHNKFIVLYAGILGIAQNLETLLNAADELRHCSDIHFLVAGAGPKKAALESRAARLGLKNLDFIGERPRNAMPELYSAVDAALVPLAKKEIFKHARPSKLFDAWACETPVLLGIEGEAKNLLDQCGGGVSYRPDDHRDLAKKIMAMKNIPWTYRRQMGKNARLFVEKHHSRRVQAAKLEKLIVDGQNQ